MMSLHDLEAREVRRQRLVSLVAVCVVALALVGLARVAPADAGASSGSTRAHVEYCHSSPDALAWCEWVEFMQDPANAAWFDWATRHDRWTVWDDLRLCEAPDWAGGWSANTGNGFYGGLQFTLQSWQAVGGSGYPHHHSRETQIDMGERLLDLQGWGAWPTCSLELGLR